MGLSDKVHDLEDFIQACKAGTAEDWLENDEDVLEAYKRMLFAVNPSFQHIMDDALVLENFKRHTAVPEECGGAFVCEQDNYIGMYEGVVYCEMWGNNPDFMEHAWYDWEDECIWDEGSWFEARNVIPVQDAVDTYKIVETAIVDFAKNFPQWKSDGYVENLLRNGQLQEVMAMAYEAHHLLGEMDFITGYVREADEVEEERTWSHAEDGLVINLTRQ